MNAMYVMTVDVTGAYLNAEVREEVHMRLDKNLAALLVTVDKSYEEYLEKDDTMLVKLNRALYGLVESAKLWYEHLKGTLERHGYKTIESDRCVFMKTLESGETVKLALHVDDMLVTSTSAEALREFETVLKQEYKGMTVHKGNVLSYLGRRTSNNHAEGIC